MVRGALVGVADPEEGRLIHWTRSKVPANGHPGLGKPRGDGDGGRACHAECPGAAAAGHHRCLRCLTAGDGRLGNDWACGDTAASRSDGWTTSTAVFSARVGMETAQTRREARGVLAERYASGQSRARAVSAFSILLEAEEWDEQGSVLRQYRLAAQSAQGRTLELIRHAPQRGAA